MVEIKTELIPRGTKRRSGTKISKVIFFVDHDTGNPNSTAHGNVTYFIKSANEMSASAHIFIDDKEAIMCIPCLDNPEKAWHVIYSNPKDNELFGDDANDIAIGMELCYFPNDKARSLKAYNKYIEVAVYLAKFHNVDPLKRSGHFELDPQRKTDPSNALKYIGKTYQDMKNDIVKKYKELYVKEVIQEVIQLFKDEKDISNWAKDSVKRMSDLGLIKGNDLGEFKPKNGITREELAVVLDRVLKYLGK
jgi:N-acetylmuramoyl-L-alanine amidase CwlA